MEYVYDKKPFGESVNVMQQPFMHTEESDYEEKPLSKSSASYLNKLLNPMLHETHDMDIVILRMDPQHPLHSVKIFQEMNLSMPLLKGIASMGYYKPSKIQEDALPSLISEYPQNMIAQSQSGTGKTATFLMAMLSRIDPTLSHCQCLCMAPTRELALQIADTGRKMARFMDSVTFGVASRESEANFDVDGYVTDHIVIGTPGTVANWAKCFGPRKIDMAKLIMFVLDEADVMMEEEGFLNISHRLKHKLSDTCQILLFSATFEDSVVEFAREYVPSPIEIRLNRTQLPLKNIKQFFVQFADWQEKYQTLVNIYGGFDVGQAIIFCATRREAAWLKGRMTNEGHKVCILSGDLEVSDREEVIRKFRSAECRVLIATNLCARGLDIPQVNLIINWNMPTLRDGSADCETYLHRIGRSGRFGKGGLALNFVTEDEAYVLHELEEYFDITISRLTDDEFGAF